MVSSFGTQMKQGSQWLTLWCVGLILLGSSCAPQEGTSPTSLASPEPSFHLSELIRKGDARRQASTGLVLTGLDFDQNGRPDRAAAQYQLAIQLDPSNPLAYLAFARHFCDNSNPLQSLSYLDKLENLQPIHQLPHGVRAHVAGIRGWALLEDGNLERAIPYLRQARSLAPSTWADARLSPEELR